MRKRASFATGLALTLLALAVPGAGRGGGGLIGFPPFAFLSNGGQQALILDAGPANAGRSYLVLGSASGTSPGTTVAGLPLALNPDDYFNFLLLSPNQAYFSTSLGALDSDGKALATIDVPPGTNPALAGLTLHHAFVLYDPVCDFVSNSVPLDLLP